MKYLIITLSFIFTSTSFAMIYERFDEENRCNLYYSTYSSFFEEGTTDQQASLAPGLIFMEINGYYDLKGLWTFSFLAIERDVNLREKKDFYTSYEFNHVCLDINKNIVYTSQPRRELL